VPVTHPDIVCGLKRIDGTWWAFAKVGGVEKSSDLGFAEIPSESHVEVIPLDAGGFGFGFVLDWGRSGAYIHFASEECQP